MYDHEYVHVHKHRNSKIVLGHTKKFDEAGVAVGFIVLLFERSFVELLQAERADEVLRVKLLVHRRDAAT